MDSSDIVLVPNNTVNNESVFGIKKPITSLNCIIIFLSVISIICNSFALYIISRCKKTSYQVRYLSCNFLVSFIVVECSICLHSLALLLKGDIFYRLIFDSRIFFSCVLVTVLWCSLCAVTVERLMALTLPLQYNKYATKITLSILIASVWTINVLCPLLAFIITGSNVCGQYISLCDIYALFRPARMVLLCFMVLYAAIIVIAYIKILSIIFYQHKLADSLTANTKYLAELSRKQKYLKSTRTVAAVVFAFIVLQSPLFFHLIVFEFKPDLQEQKWRIIFQGIDYLGHQMNTYATLYLYIWKFRECRMYLLFFFSKWNKNLLERANSLRVDVFEIVLKENRASKSTRKCTVTT